MTTQEFNKKRADAWVEKLTKDEARIFLIVGMKQNGSWAFFGDDSQTKVKVAEKLEEMAKMIRNS